MCTMTCVDTYQVTNSMSCEHNDKLLKGEEPDMCRGCIYAHNDFATCETQCGEVDECQAGVNPPTIGNIAY